MELVDIFEEMVTTGQPPSDNCSLLGVGYDQAFQALKKVYLERGFARGRSTEKFIIGPYGSGKTHFLRQLLELSQQMDCVTAEVPLSQDVDISKPLLIYKEVVRALRVPEQKIPGKGLGVLISDVLERFRVESGNENGEWQDEFVCSRIAAFEDYPFEDERFRRIVPKTLLALFRGENDIYESGLRWLAGEVNDALVAKALGIGRIPTTEQDGFGRRALLCLCQFIKEAGYRGTVIGFDEAEQAMNVPKRTVQRILSMARAEIDFIARVNNAAVLVVYAFTPDVVQEMQQYPALQQRLAEPDPSRLFFDGNIYSPRIELDQVKLGSLEFLENISERLIKLFYQEYGDELKEPMEEILRQSRDWAEEISSANPSISNRREIVKLTCSKLLELYDGFEGFSYVEPENPGDAEV